LALQTLDVIFHSFYLRKFGNNDSEIWSLNFEVLSPKSEVWRYLSLSVYIYDRETL
jgi:hypothetical protein